MITKNFTVRVLEASEGYVLTQVEEVDVMNRILSDRVFLGVTDSEDNWKEITAAKAAEIEKERLEKEEELKRELLK